MIRIIEATPLEGYRLKIRFNDGVHGIYPVEPERRGGVFRKLLDPAVFNAVQVNLDFGCLEWPGRGPVPQINARGNARSDGESFHSVKQEPDVRQ